MKDRKKLFDNVISTSMDTVLNVDLKITLWSFVHALNKKLRLVHPEYPKMTGEMKKDYVQYYRSFGFPAVWTDWVEYIYRVTGTYDRRFIPDDLFNIYIDCPYRINRDAWMSKAFQPAIFPEAQFPRTVVKKLGDYYFDEENRIIDAKKAENIIKDRPEVVIKHVIGGGGTDIDFCNTETVTEDYFSKKKYDFIVQDLIEQSPFMAQFNSSSVNIIKFTSFIFRGEVHILSARLWVGGVDCRLSNSSGGRGRIVSLSSTGDLYDYSVNLLGEKIYETASGVTFKGKNVEFYQKCVDLIREGHKRLFYFPFISWDFTQDKNGNVILIEYNLKYHILYDIQILTGPVFGDYTEDVLKAAKPAIENNRGLFF